MNAGRHPIFATASALLVFSMVGAALLSGTFQLTRPAIEQSERQAKLKLIAQTLPADSFDNDLVREARPLPADPLLGLRLPGQYYVAQRHGRPVAIILEAAAPDGYAGEIRLLVGIQPDGRISGVRVTGHRETPGLGDYIEIDKSPWIRTFENKSLSYPHAVDWKVRKDGGQFDYMAGATITPRAIVKAVKQALSFFQAHRDELLASPQPAPEGSKP